MEDSIHLVILLFLEVQYFPLPVHYKAQRYGLYASCRKFWLYLSPEHRGELEPYQPVQYPAGLLGIHKIHIDLPRGVDGVKYRRFCNLMEHDSSRVFFLEPESVIEMPADGFSLPVFIGCEPYCSGVFRCFLQLGDNFLLVIRDYIFGLEAVFNIYAQ